jgi:hypothetical protein
MRIWRGCLRDRTIFAAGVTQVACSHSLYAKNEYTADAIMDHTTRCDLFRPHGLHRTLDERPASTQRRSDLYLIVRRWTHVTTIFGRGGNASTIRIWWRSFEPERCAPCMQISLKVTSGRLPGTFEKSHLGRRAGDVLKRTSIKPYDNQMRVYTMTSLIPWDS